MNAKKPLIYLAASGFLLQILESAYIEPGSTSFFLKLLISSLAGLAISARFIWGKVRHFFSQPEEEDTEGGEQLADEDDPARKA